MNKWLIIILVLLLVGAIFAGGIFFSSAAPSKRDLSTPSSRLVGHWERADGQIYYGAAGFGCGVINSFGTGVIPTGNISNILLEYKLRNGIILSSDSKNIPIRYKILSEDRSGEKLVIREYWLLDYATPSDIVECYISKNGYFMVKEYIGNDGNNVLLHYHYVDNVTGPPVEKDTQDLIDEVYGSQSDK
jgi:hypothetical protein